MTSYERAKKEGGGYILGASLIRESVESFAEYPFSMPAIKKLKNLPLDPKITFFIGENGSGKSTLLEAIAIKLGLNPEGGSRNFDFATRTSHSDLHEHVELTWPPSKKKIRDMYFLRAESFFNVATQIEELDKEKGDGTIKELRFAYGGQSLHEQSHGESFFALMTKRFGQGGLYLMDEPEAALSPKRQLSSLTLLHDLIGCGCQFIIATHSPILMAYPNALIYEFSDKGIRKIEYEETEHYRVTRDFLNRKDKMLEILLEDEKFRDDLFE